MVAASQEEEVLEVRTGQPHLECGPGGAVALGWSSAGDRKDKWCQGSRGMKESCGVASSGSVSVGLR